MNTRKKQGGRLTRNGMSLVLAIVTGTALFVADAQESPQSTSTPEPSESPEPTVSPEKTAGPPVAEATLVTDPETEPGEKENKAPESAEPKRSGADREGNSPSAPESPIANMSLKDYLSATRPPGANGGEIWLPPLLFSGSSMAVAPLPSTGAGRTLILSDPPSAGEVAASRLPEAEGEAKKPPPEPGESLSATAKNIAGDPPAEEPAEKVEKVEKAGEESPVATASATPVIPPQKKTRDTLRRIFGEKNRSPGRKPQRRGVPTGSPR